MKRIITLLFCLCVLFISCSKEALLKADIRALRQHGYFPLHIGNEWDYLSGLQVRTDIQETIDGIEYYRFISSRGNRADTTYYREDSHKIFEKSVGRLEILRFDLKAKERETWSFEEFPDTPYQFIASLTDKDATVDTENFEFRNCYQFYYDIPELADDEHEIFLAKGIGLVKQVYWGGFQVEPGLIRVKINGKEVFF